MCLLVDTGVPVLSFSCHPIHPTLSLLSLSVSLLSLSLSLFLLHQQTWNVEFRDRIVDWSIGFGHLVAATANQCAIYTTSNLNTPKAQMDLNAAPSLILQSPGQFAIVGAADSAGVTVYTYEGRTLCSPRFAGLRTEFLNARVTSLTDDVLAVLDVSDSRTIHCFLTSRNGEAARSVPVRHTHEIVDLAVSSHPDEPLLAFIDKNRDLCVDLSLLIFFFFFFSLLFFPLFFPLFFFFFSHAQITFLFPPFVHPPDTSCQCIHRRVVHLHLVRASLQALVALTVTSSVVVPPRSVLLSNFIPWWILLLGTITLIFSSH